MQRVDVFDLEKVGNNLLCPNKAVTLGKRQLVDSIWKSAGIEGLGTTFSNTSRILSNLLVETRSEEVFFIINMKRAWYFLFDNLECEDNLAFLREVNKVVLDRLAYGAGELRTCIVSIGGTDWKPEIPSLDIVVQELERISKISNCVERALEMFCYICRAQLFIDGNKRVAQLMCNKILMQNNIGILSVPYKLVPDFKEKLVDYYESNDPETLKKFLREEALMLV